MPVPLRERQEQSNGEGEPGEVIASGKQGLVIACGQGAVAVTQLQAPGGKAMAAADYLRGHPIPVGTHLG